MDLTTSILFALGFILLISGAELLVRGASFLAEAVGISPLVVGLTVVAYGTSAPELAVTIQSTYANPPQPDIAIGNIVGSNISNILLVLGISAVMAPLVVSRELLRSSVPLMILVAFLLYILGWDGVISRTEGVFLTVSAMAYTIYAIVQSRRETRKLKSNSSEDTASQSKSIPWTKWLSNLVLILIGLAMLIKGADWLVDGAVKVAKLLQVSELVIGLTIVAVGTSLPEIATSLVASIRGQRDIAVGNVVGSNIFNILLVLGICACAAPAGVPVSSAAFRFDIPVMILATLACFPIFFSGYTIYRWEGFLFLGYYCAYATFLFLKATEHEAVGIFGWVMVAIAAPLTTVTLGYLMFQSLKKGNQSEEEQEPKRDKQ